jgi:tetratricopeptide (TPR) repeat protein
MFCPALFYDLTVGGQRMNMAAGDWTGLTVGHYEILDLLGRGGMGVVYRARDKNLSVLRALKVLGKSGDSESCRQALQRFLAEARSVSALNHPNIIACHDYGEGPDGTPYVVMDLLEGRTLADLIASGESLSLERILAIMIQVCRGLEHAHGRGILHRDIKPSNIMLVSDENGLESVKILDFGIAKAIGIDKKRGPALTKTGEIIGTPSYMSPEQGQGHEVDERSDIYSFGCVFYELLKGELPFEEANTVKTILKHIMQEPLPLVSKPGLEIPPALSQLVLCCLEKAPSARYQSAEQIRLQLEKIKDGEALADLQITLKTRKLANKLSRLVPGLLAGAALFVVCLAAYFAWQLSDRAASVEAESRFQRAIAFRDSSKYAEAVGEISRAIKLKPDLFRYYDLRGSLYASLCKYRQAADDFTVAIKLNPGAASAYFNRASACQLDRRFQKAVGDYTLAIEKDPKNAQAYKFRADCYSELQNFQKAVDDCNKALELNPGDAAAYQSRAWLYGNMGQSQNALADYSRAVELEPGNAQAHKARGDCYCQLGSFGKAVADFSEAIELNRQDAAAYNSRGWAYCGLSQYEKAVADADKAISLDEKLAVAYDTRAFAYHGLGQFERALADYSRSLSLDARSGVVFLHRSYTYEKLGKRELASLDRASASRLGCRNE